MSTQNHKIALMSDTKPKLINANKTKQPNTSITRLNELESAEKRKEILNGYISA